MSKEISEKRGDRFRQMLGIIALSVSKKGSRGARPGAERPALSIGVVGKV